MKNVNSNKELWTNLKVQNLTVEELEKREEYTSLTPGCCFQLGSCCLKACINCCFVF